MIDILVIADVADDVVYSKYRAEMSPLLAAHGGSFGVDVRVGEVLRSPEKGNFNRLFTMRFPSLEQHDAFFSNPTYLEIRKRLFEPSVSSVHIIGKYDVLT